MPRRNYNDLHAFATAAQSKNFSQAAQKLGISPPALSKTIRLLEARLGVQLFNRTTRSVALTQAGEALFAAAHKSFATLDGELERLAHYRDTPAGKVKITAGLQVIQDILIPRLARFQHQYPDIVLEFHANNRFVDIAGEGFDAGIRLDGDVDESMVAVRISEPLAMCVAGAPGLFERHGFVKTIHRLNDYPAVGYVLGSGKLYEWTLFSDGLPVKITPNAQFVCDDDQAVKTACLHGLGLAYLPQSLIAQELADGRLISILQTHCPPLPALYLYYPHRNISPALRAVVDELRA